ncbi:MAG: c-type cytochrome [Gemmatimonadales bacterium]
MRAILGAVIVLAACRIDRAPPPAKMAVVDTTVPAGPLGEAIRRGRGIMLATRESLPDQVGNRLRCVSCHLDEGRRPEGTWVGVYARYPQYRSRSASIQLIEDRVNDCFERSLNGKALPANSREMRDIVAYLWWLSRGVPVAEPPAKEASRFAGFRADTAGGRVLFGQQCALCHGVSGEGSAAAPAVWGPQSYNIGAGMARANSAAAFIRANMPFAAPGTLTDQQALDVAAYIDSQHRPDFPAKAGDWPNGGAPPDLPYQVRAGRQ